MSVTSNLSVIVVAYHGADLLDTCLAALAGGVPVVVVDNSSDPAVAAVARRHGTRYVDAEGNLGFGAGVNVGLRHVPANADVLLLNPDAVLTLEALRRLHAHLHAPGNDDVAALSPRLVSPTSHEEQRVRWPFPTPLRRWSEVVGLHHLRQPPDEFCVGAVLLLRAEALAQIGRFDERFFLYAEETDWQRRAVLANWRCIEAPDVTAEHVGAGTSKDSSRREALFHAGTETYIRKWYGPAGWSAYRGAVVLGGLVRAALYRDDRSRVARQLAALYLRGPRAVAGLDGRARAAGPRGSGVAETNTEAGQVVEG